MGEEVMGPRTPLDDPDHLVGQRIDDVLDVPGVVALENPHHDPVIGVAPGDMLSGERCPEERDPQKQQEEPDLRPGAHGRPPEP
jgi:hypothetical protein